MIVPLIIALLGTVSCHGSRNFDSSAANADYGNAQYANAQNENFNYANGQFANTEFRNAHNGSAQYANAEFGNGPMPYSGINEISADTVYFVNPNTFKNVTVRAGNGNCKNVGFDFGITAVQATIFLNGEWCSPGDNVEWSLTLDMKLKVFGIQLLNDKFHFNPKYSEIHRNLHLGVAKADIRVGVYNYCIKIIGNACYWAGKWRCGDIYEVPHCFKSQNFYSTYLRSNAVQFNEGGDCPSRMRQIAALAHSEF